MSTADAIGATRQAVALLNPMARRAGTLSERDLRDALGPRWSIDVVTPRDAASTTRAADDAAQAGASVVFAGGGDGTAADVARGLAGTNVPVALLPLGTANDLARALGVPRDPRDAAVSAAAAVTSGRTRALDLVSVNGQRFCTVGGVGIVADSAMLAGRLKAATGPTRRLTRASGSAIYRLTAPWALLRRSPLASPMHLSLTTPDGATAEVELSSPGLFVANQRHCGGGLTLPGVGRDDDGLFELLIIQDVARVRLLDAFTRLTLRLPIAETVLRVVPARAARIVCSRDETFLGDGDALVSGRTFDITALPRALHVAV